ncbi:MAG: aspartate aminotransferase family protein [Candidatus Lambdaproteobacteria bacterium]|nr:aspartate aminotransferase family protein [Candidatus Lambdaproteobacteria bacterium]
MTEQKSTYAQRDIGSYLHPYTNLSTHAEVGPLIITDGKGIYVSDEAGHEYIEGMAGLWCTSLGFGEQELVEAAIAQMRRLPTYHSFRSRSTLPGIDLAERLLAVAPVPMSKAFFANSGSEANDTAVKLIWYYNAGLGRPEKRKMIGRHYGYHGVTIAATSLTGVPRNHTDFNVPLPGFVHTDMPHHYRHARPGESEEDFATRLAANLEALILAEGPQTVAAFFAEPVMGAGGVILPPRTYFEKVQAVLRRHDVLFVADEVICGFGRTGNMWGTQTYKLHPDIVTCAKGLSSAYLPISAVMISEQIYQGLVQQSRKHGVFAHGFTYTGHPVCSAVALKTLEIMQKRDIVGHVRQVAPALQGAVQALGQHPLVGHARGIGLIAALELMADKGARKAFPPENKVGEYCMDRAQAHGLLIRSIGDTIAICPPLIITAEQIGTMMERLSAALDDTLAWVRKG